MKLTASVLLVGLLVGCGSEATPTTTSGSRSDSAASGSPTVARDQGARAENRNVDERSEETREARKKAADALKAAIDTRYSYKDRLSLDWDALFAGAMAEIEDSPSRDALVAALVKLLAHAKDAHLDIIVDGKVTPTDPTKIEWNFALDQIKKRVSDFKPVGRCMATGTVDGFAYVLVSGLEKGKCDALPADWDGLFPSIKSAPGLILDLRGNGGGDEVKAQKIAAYFVTKPTPYAKSTVRDPKAPGGFTEPHTRSIVPTDRGTYTGRVVVLTGPYIMSSAESFVLMMKEAGATLIGGRTRGASANPVLVDLGQGIQVRVPTWRATLVNGELYEGIGVAPDIEVPVTKQDVASGDKLIDAAVVFLKKP